MSLGTNTTIQKAHQRRCKTKLYNEKNNYDPGIKKKKTMIDSNKIIGTFLQYTNHKHHDTPALIP